MVDKIVEMFDSQPSGSYDERNKPWAAVFANLNFLTRMVLKDLPNNAKILSVGVGTGIEIAELARVNPNWTFDAVDPSTTMLDDCRKRFVSEGILDRCRLTHGYLSDFDGMGPYDAVLCFLVMHFIRDEDEKLAMYADMNRRLCSGGYLITAEISYDQTTAEYLDIVEHWRSMNGHASTPQAADAMIDMIRTKLGVVGPETTKRLLRAAGFPMPVQFAQSLLIHCWYARRDHSPRK